MYTRDIPFDKECPERSDTFRETFGEPCSLADLEAARRKWADNLDSARERMKGGAVMLPHFTIEERDGRWYVETDWCVALTPSSSLTYNLQVTSGGKLDTASAGWATREKAEAAVEACKRRLR